MQRNQTVKKAVMKYVTEFQAIDPADNKLKTWRGETIEAPSWGMAEQWCRENKGYLKVTGQLISQGGVEEVNQNN